MKIHLLTGKKLAVFLHIVGWSILFILPSYLLYIDSSEDMPLFLVTSAQTVCYAIIFYLNYLWLAPKLYFKKKKILYFISAALLIMFMSTLVLFADVSFRPGPTPHPAMDEPRPLPQLVQGNPSGAAPAPGFPAKGTFRDGKRRPPPKQWPYYNFLLTSVFITGFSIGLCYSDKVIQQEKQRKEAEQDKLNTELAFLKNQINPHFFFNTLNNIYSLVQTSVQDGQKAILQLSKLMRYLLYESEKGNNLLSQEIDFMKNYIELMKLRLSPKVSLDVTFPNSYTDVSIPPLLFLPFIENAFKHGISYRHASFIKVSVKADPEELVFECRNSVGTNGDDLLKSGSGIGLENVKKRLRLLFPQKHHLEIIESGMTFNVILHIEMGQKTLT